MESRFYKHDVVSHREGLVTRIWYPYGDTCDGSSIIVGTKNFATQLMDLESERSQMMHDWVKSRVKSWSYPGAKPHATLMAADQFYEKCRGGPSWYRMFFAAPLIIVGASLPLEDWPIWWLLHQRARNLTVLPGKIPPTFFLTAQGEARPHLSGRPSEIEVAEFPSHDALWKFVFRA
jgi:hypothetical protein